MYWAVVITILISIVPPSNGVSFNSTGIQCSGGDGVAIRMTAREFFESYSTIFHMSDGSKIDIPDDRINMPIIAGKSLRYMKTLMMGIGIKEDRTDRNGITLVVCPERIIDLMLLGVIGNFITSPADPDLSSSSSMPGIASIVIDVYTGAITIVNPYSVIRSFFLETLLIISVLSIARFSIISNIPMGANK